MRKVLVYSLLLLAGLVGSQFLDRSSSAPGWMEKADLLIRLGTMVALAFIMVHVGYEFEIDKERPRRSAWDFVVAATAAAFPWIFCALYFVFVMAPRGMWGSVDLWKEALLEACFASPTSAGILFSMLAAAGLGATWVFKKARILAIFDDLDILLLLIPLKILIVGFKWQLGVIVVVIGVLLWLAWKYLHAWKLPITWPYVLSYGVAVTIASEAIYFGSKLVDREVPIHLEVLLPAFALGCVLARPRGADPHSDDAREGTEEGPEDAKEQKVSTIISACFMVLVGLSMPTVKTPASVPAAGVAATDAMPSDFVAQSALRYEDVPAEVIAEKKKFPGWGKIALHVAAITVLCNLGKMFPVFCYRGEATFRERLALSIGMFPRGEVGAGVLVIAIGYGLAGPALTVAVLSLVLNLLCTGLFIVGVKKLLRSEPA